MEEDFRSFRAGVSKNFNSKLSIKVIMKKLTLFLLLFYFSSFSAIFAQFDSQTDLLKITGYLSLDNVHPGSEVKIAVKVDIEKDWHINSNRPKEDFLIPSELKIESETPFLLINTYFPEAKDIKLGFSDELLSVYEGEIIIGALIKVPDELPPGEYKLIIDFGYQACNNFTCLAPNNAYDTLVFSVVNKEVIVNEINKEIFNKVDLSYSNKIVSQSTDDPITKTLEQGGLLLGLVLIFLGGLALNLTPCVYPLIPITIGFFGGQSEGKTGKLAAMGALYVLGMAITYSAIGVITALSGAVFGALLQNVYVIIIIVLIFVALSLSMFGLYEFKLPDSLVAKAGGAKSGMFGAFFMGLTMGIVAAPCVGPFVIGLVTFVAAKADPYLGFLLFFVLALGLGLPYFLLAIFSGKIKSLPRAGAWMDSVKSIFGLLLLGMAFYFLLPVLPKSISGYVLPIYMILAALYLIFFEKDSVGKIGFKIFKYVFAFILLAFSAYSLYPVETKSIEWTPFTEESFVQSKEENKKIILDFYADWCIPCKELKVFLKPQKNLLHTK
jgi:thiol:disulfide interchange protein DsbD